MSSSKTSYTEQAWWVFLFFAFNAEAGAAKLAAARYEKARSFATHVFFIFKSS
jgi:hypothetical protein